MNCDKKEKLPIPKHLFLGKIIYTYKFFCLYKVLCKQLSLQTDTKVKFKV